ncbi:aminotransferase class IV [Clostridium tunisiense]|uniref:aminotransferase class IV n=1 Tax=Clostridium tunisiense TaxID=219748 RepID=UPI0002D8F7BD|nr:aminotransferase class IV [Clostridium tunisiense]
MEKSYVFYQGEIIEEKDVNISIRCKAFNYGLGCFEGIRAYWDEESRQLYLFRLKEHYERLLQSCKALWINIPYTAEELCEFTLELLRKHNFKTTVYIRPVAYKGSNALFPTLYDDDNMIPARTKPTGGYLNSALASLEVLQNGYDEAILLTNEGYVCEGPGENIFIFKNNQLITPPPSDNILEGITRKTIIELASKELGIEVVERSITRTELYSAKEAFFSGTAMEVTSIVEIDNRKIGDGKPGEVCRKVKELFFGMTKGKNPNYSAYCTAVY